MKTDKGKQHREHVETEISAREAGRRGGNSTLQNQGREFFSRIGKKGGKKTSKLYRNMLKEFGKKGGRPKRPSLD